MSSELKKLSDQFLRMYPLKDASLKPVLDHLAKLKYEDSMEYQHQLLSNTVQHPVALKYPPSSTYCQRFLKILISMIEEVDQEVNDDLYTHYTKLLSHKSPENNETDSHCYKTYSLDLGITITLKEKQSIISEGTTGMFTWQASHILADWCRKNSSSLRNKSVLELGAGLGMTGLSVIKTCNPRSYVFTDLHATVLRTLKGNILINLGSSSSVTDSNIEGDSSEINLESDPFKTCYNGMDVSVEKLDWMSDHIRCSCDVILAADVVYDTEIINPLVNIVKEGLGSNEGTVAYVASTIRNPKTFEYFKQTLVEKEVKIASETQLAYQETPSQPESVVVILQLIL